MENFKPIQNSERGSAQLTMVLVAAAIGGVVMLSNIAMFTEIGKSNRNASQVAAAGSLQKGIEGLLKEIPNCVANFQGMRLDGTRRTTDLVTSAGAIAFDTDGGTTYENGMLLLRSYSLTQEGVIRTTPNYEVFARLNLEMEKTGQTVGATMVRKSVRMLAVLSGPGGTIQSCYGVFGGENIIWSRSDDNIFQTDLSNKVGIGTTDPAELFSVGPNRGNFRVNSEGDVLVTGGTDGRWGLYTGGTERLAVTSTGVVTSIAPMTFSNDPPRSPRARLSVNSGNVEINTSNLTSYPANWGDGLHTWDVYAEGTVAVGRNGNQAAYMNTSGNGYFSNSLGIRRAPSAAYSLDVSGQTRSDQFCIGGSCRTTFAEQSCAAGQVPIRLRVDGTIECASTASRLDDALNCPNNTYFAGMSGSSPICRSLPTGSCPANQYIESISPTGTISCRPIPPEVAIPSCPAGQYVSAINAGVPVCSRPPAAGAGQSCPTGEVVKGVSSSGTLICESASGAATPITGGAVTVYSNPDGNYDRTLPCHSICALSNTHDCDTCGYSVAPTAGSCPAGKSTWRYIQRRGGSSVTCWDISGTAPAAPTVGRVTSYSNPDGNYTRTLACHNFCALADTHDCNGCGHSVAPAGGSCPVGKSTWTYIQYRGSSRVTCWDLD